MWRRRTEISQSQPTALPTNTFRPPTSLTSLKPLQARGQQSESQHNNISTEAHCPTLVFPDISHCNVCVLYHWDTDTRVKSFFILCVIEDLLASTAVSVVSTVQEIYGPAVLDPADCQHGWSGQTSDGRHLPVRGAAEEHDAPLPGLAALEQWRVL